MDRKGIRMPGLSFRQIASISGIWSPVRDNPQWPFHRRSLLRGRTPEESDVLPHQAEGGFHAQDLRDYHVGGLPIGYAGRRVKLGATTDRQRCQRHHDEHRRRHGGAYEHHHRQRQHRLRKCGAPAHHLWQSQHRLRRLGAPDQHQWRRQHRRGIRCAWKHQRQ